MALKKEYTDIRGAKVCYHRIDKISKGYGYINVTINSYATEELRGLEKEYLTLSAMMSNPEITTELFELTGANEDLLTEEQIARRDELVTKMNRYESMHQYGETHLLKRETRVPYTDGDEISYDKVYQWLIENDEILKDAEII